ncbi:hypothetical protein G8O24_03090 [Bradyrhizobium sp. INPA01-394B]|uniref:Tetratricopeptide repeat protein n=1 Tax=Bradyrhizobium campsiandrae TaxID=1729892 RepID=A0ABR7U9G3_9BRAD|nr:hypothetical protein [Bradyrhizobium campsiandrae]MBC9876331.1 hypothetical protein [Bradyrhizobium campsiandrae]MBC9980146.1 hypothetical protein [Bradyrhizobium campsiandrae]
MTSFESVDVLHEWIEDLRRSSSIATVIRTVAARLPLLEDEGFCFLSDELVSLLREAGRDTEALAILDAKLRRDPSDVRPGIVKANIYDLLDQPIDALKSINVALVRAHRTGFFRREALGNKARILLRLGRGDEFSDVLEEIISLEILPGVPDVGRERDFVDRAPPGFIRKNVLDRYNEFRPKRPDDRLADEPPEYEQPNDYM